MEPFCVRAVLFAYDNISMDLRRTPMKKVIGYTLFWIAVGMLIALLLSNLFWSVLLIFVLLLIGYNLFIC